MVIVYKHRSDPFSIIGSRLRLRFPAVFSSPYHPRVYDFKSSAKLRALESGSACAQGLFPGLKHLAMPSLDVDQDPLLRFHKACPKYHQLVKKNATVLDHGPVGIVRRKYLAEVADSVYAKYSHVLKRVLSHSELTSLWDACKMEVRGVV